MRACGVVRIHRRVRQLYLEFMTLAPEFSNLPQHSSEKKFFFRVESASHPAAVALLSQSSKAHAAGGESISMLAPTSHHREERSDPDCGSKAEPQSASGCTFLIEGHTVASEALDSLLPPNWSNHRANTKISGERNTLQYRAMVQKGFYQVACLVEGSDEWKRSLARGRYELRKVREVIHVRKYRALNKRYAWASQLSIEELEQALGSAALVQEATLGLSNKNSYGYRD